jgi:hypothetical protein
MSTESYNQHLKSLGVSYFHEERAPDIYILLRVITSHPGGSTEHTRVVDHRCSKSHHNRYHGTPASEQSWVEENHFPPFIFIINNKSCWLCINTWMWNEWEESKHAQKGSYYLCLEEYICANKLTSTSKRMKNGDLIPATISLTFITTLAV